MGTGKEFLTMIQNPDAIMKKQYIWLYKNVKFCIKIL